MFLIYSAHVAICVLIILVILFQDGKTGGLTGVADQASQQVFGAKGAGNFLTKLTTGLAIAFMFTSLSLALFHKTDDKGIADNYIPEKKTESTSIAPDEKSETSETKELPTPQIISTPANGESGDVVITDEDGNETSSSLADSIESIKVMTKDEVPKEILEMHQKDRANVEKNKKEAEAKQKADK